MRLNFAKQGHKASLLSNMLSKLLSHPFSSVYTLPAQRASAIGTLESHIPRINLQVFRNLFLPMCGALALRLMYVGRISTFPLTLGGPLNLSINRL